MDEVEGLNENEKQYSTANRNQPPPLLNDEQQYKSFEPEALEQSGQQSQPGAVNANELIEMKRISFTLMGGPTVNENIEINTQDIDGSAKLIAFGAETMLGAVDERALISFERYSGFIAPSPKKSRRN